MRKYQQLLLLLCCCFSVTVLLIYKSENNRLKYVLRVVNFFGRSDAAVALQQYNSSTQEEQLDFMHPLPVWQAIGDSFHAYVAYWIRNELVAGGESLALVSGRRGAVINFRCALIYDGGARSVQGKFHFQRVDGDSEDKGSDFTSYNFFCRLTRDFGDPESVAFTDATTAAKVAQQLHLRYVKNARGEQTAPQPATICLNLLGDASNSSGYVQSDTNLLQFFLHHHLSWGVDHFLIYNGDEIPRRVLRSLHRLRPRLRLHLLPFNFPFARGNATNRLRHIIEADCLMRSTNLALHTMLLSPNEFVLPNAAPGDGSAVLRSLNHYASDITRFELPSFAVCLDPARKLLVDSTMYDSEAHLPHRLFIYALKPISTTLSEAPIRSVALPLSIVLAHRYHKCLQVGSDGLHDWRNALREDFMQRIQMVRNEVDAILV